MLIDPRRQSPAERLEADVVVAGAGTMGLYLAAALARAGKSVIVVESGPVVATVGSGPTTVSGRRQDGVHTGRARGLGGTSVLWGGQLTEFDAHDFTHSAAPWPISLDDLKPWYAAVYARLGVGPPQSDAVYRARLGGEAAPVAGIERFFTSWLPEPNFARVFRREVLNDRRITVLLDTTVDGAEFVGERAVALTASAAGRPARLVGQAFVFAMGTIANARFFLSTARTHAVPWRDQALIGTGFQDHFAGPVARVVVGDEARFRNYFENAVVDGLKLQPKLRWTPTARDTMSGELGVSGSFVFNSDVGTHVANLKHVVRAMRSAAGLSSLARLPLAMLAVGRSFAPFVWRYLRDRRIMAFFDRSLDFMIQGEQMPLGDSRITLVGDAPAADGLFAVDVDWRVDGAEIDGVARFALAVDLYLRAAGIGALEIDPRLVARDPAFMAGLIDTIHHSGGMAMATGPESGVVDADLRVFGTANVYVAGAAVFPTSSHANCTLTALALTERLAAHLGRPK